jgi:hypothetical protein
MVEMLHWWKGMEWINLAEDSNKGEDNNKPLGSVNGWEFND